MVAQIIFISVIPHAEALDQPIVCSASSAAAVNILTPCNMDVYLNRCRWQCTQIEGFERQQVAVSICMHVDRCPDRSVDSPRSDHLKAESRTMRHNLRRHGVLLLPERTPAVAVFDLEPTHHLLLSRVIIEQSSDIVACRNRLHARRTMADNRRRNSASSIATMAPS